MGAAGEDEARRCFEQAYRAQTAGRLDDAVALYRRALSLGPTTEAHTFLGRTYSMMGRWEEAELHRLGGPLD
jgi:tetratricopeptide (TPR) repeat protein